MSLDTELDSVPIINEEQAKKHWYHHLADVTYKDEKDSTVREGLYAVGKEGTNPKDRLFFYHQLTEFGEGIKNTFGTIPIEKIKKYRPMMSKK